MKFAIRAAMPAFLAWSCGCSGVSVAVDYDSAPPLPALRSFAWEEGSASLHTPEDRRIRRSLDSQLRSQGYLPAQSGSPDFLVSYQQEMVGFRKNELILVVDICDPGTKHVLWRSMARATLSLDTTPKDQDERIQSVVAHMLEHFPPR